MKACDNLAKDPLIATCFSSKKLDQVRNKESNNDIFVENSYVSRCDLDLMSTAEMQSNVPGISTENSVFQEDSDDSARDPTYEKGMNVSTTDPKLNCNILLFLFSRMP